MKTTVGAGLPSVGYSMKNQNTRPTHYLEKHFPIEGRKDFFKWVIETPNGLAKDFEGNVMYFDHFNLERAKDTLRAIKRTVKMDKNI